QFYSTQVWSDELIAKIDFNDAAVLDVVQILARQSGLDVIISGDNSIAQSKRTSLHLKNVSAEEAIEHVLLTNGLTYEKKGSAILISMSPQLTNDNVFQGAIKIVKLKYLTAENVSALLSKILPALKASQGGSENTLILRGKEPLIQAANDLISSIDHPVPQILIESKVLELSEADSMRLGLSYGSEPGTFRFISDKSTRKTQPATDLLTTLNALVSDGKANVVATPRIATLDGHEAVINIGSRIPYAVPVSNGSGSTQWTVEYIDAGVKLKITPWLGEAKHVTASIKPEVSSISQWRTTAAGDFPIISTRNAQATLRVKDGETIVVGGLISESNRENVSRLPVVGYIPLIGMLFQNKTLEKTKTEIVFLITPHVI
ncbi:MAG: secretin and TonB N-terminal domain-containing protein, partial [Candidatus Margulisbacteria bacterium]|nr:secretin and TonB N-terminal domain-containing protein [Candidatus Margulisiibacteriota bacterium]